MQLLGKRIWNKATPSGVVFYLSFQEEGELCPSQ